MSGLWSSRRAGWLSTVGLVVAVCLISGCSGDSGYDISGTVSFDGKPIPAGKIYFRPDGSKNNVGQTGYANIVDGKYDTAAEGGKPMAGGAIVVGIDGIDPSGAKTDGTSGEEVSTALFPYYEIPVELPQENTTKDFEVPAEAAKVKYAEERPNTTGP